MIFFTIYFVLAIKLDFLTKKDLDDTFMVWEFGIMLVYWIASFPLKFVNFAKEKQSNRVTAVILIEMEFFGTIIFALIGYWNSAFLNGIQLLTNVFLLC